MVRRGSLFLVPIGHKPNSNRLVVRFRGSRNCKQIELSSNFGIF